jgi:hypothetical protein
MRWQDLILTIAQIVFLIALFPSVFSKDKPALKTSVINSVMSVGVMLVYFSMSLCFAAALIGINAFLWFVLAMQKHKQKKHK